MSQQGMTPEFALGYCAMMLDGIQREAECTKRVIAAVPDEKSDYRHDPNGRTAKDLAWHIANTDVQFLDGIADLNFGMANPESKPQTSAGGVVRREHQTWLLARCRNDGRAVDDAGKLLWRVQPAGSAVSRISE